MKRLSSLLYILVLCSSCSTVKLNKVEVKGVVYDSETEAPIKDAVVKVKISEPWETFETETGGDGQFSISSDGSLVLSDSFVEEADYKKGVRKVIVSLSHPDFVEDVYEEEIDIAPVDTKQVDIGAFYLSGKEKEDFAQRVASESQATAEATVKEEAKKQEVITSENKDSHESVTVPQEQAKLEEGTPAVEKLPIKENVDRANKSSEHE